MEIARDISAKSPRDATPQHHNVVAPATVEASLLARHLMHWGARTCMAPDAELARRLLPERAWSAVLVDHALGRSACDALARADVPQRIVLVKPSARHELPALSGAGFSGFRGPAQGGPRGLAADGGPVAVGAERHRGRRNR